LTFLLLLTGTSLLSFCSSLYSLGFFSFLSCSFPCLISSSISFFSLFLLSKREQWWHGAWLQRTEERKLCELEQRSSVVIWELIHGGVWFTVNDDGGAV
jgi:hypothetical protein